MKVKITKSMEYRLPWWRPRRDPDHSDPSEVGRTIYHVSFGLAGTYIELRKYSGYYSTIDDAKAGFEEWMGDAIRELITGSKVGIEWEVVE